jgi:histidinol-phosphate aminotransferase
LDDTEHVLRTRANNFDGMRFLEQGLRQLGLTFIPSAANFILAKVGDGGRVFALLQKQGVITRPMSGYQLSEFIRISVGTPAENQRCLIALQRVLERPNV